VAHGVGPEFKSQYCQKKTKWEEADGIYPTWTDGKAFYLGWGSHRGTAEST
jgi:hypothetical protein